MPKGRPQLKISAPSAISSMAKLEKDKSANSQIPCYLSSSISNDSCVDPVTFLVVSVGTSDCAKVDVLGAAQGSP